MRAASYYLPPQFPVHIYIRHTCIHCECLILSQADNFFVPPLNLLSEKLKLSPSIAGITLLAVGNGAPDVFVAYSGLQQDNIELVLG